MQEDRKGQEGRVPSLTASRQAGQGSPSLRIEGIMEGGQGTGSRGGRGGGIKRMGGTGGMGTEMARGSNRKSRAWGEESQESLQRLQQFKGM